MVRTPLELDATRAYAHAVYGARQRPSGRLYYHYALDVSAIARKCLQRYYKERVSKTSNEVEWQELWLGPQAGEHSDWVEHAGLLLPAIYRFGRTHDELCDETNPNVATLVAAASADGRLPVPQRNIAFKAQLAEATPCAQVLILADILVTATEYEEWCRQFPAATAEHGDLLNFAEFITADTARMCGELSVLGAVRRTTLRRWAHDADRLLTGQAAAVDAMLTEYNVRQQIAKQQGKPSLRCPNPRTKAKTSSATSTPSSAKTPKTQGERSPSSKPIPSIS